MNHLNVFVNRILGKKGVRKNVEGENDPVLYSLMQNYNLQFQKLTKAKKSKQ